MRRDGKRERLPSDLEEQPRMGDFSIAGGLLFLPSFRKVDLSPSSFLIG
jgi:hypothetical protein